MTSIAWSQHLIILPILLPLLIGAVLAPINEARHGLKFGINLLSTATTLALACLLLGLVDNEYWQDGIGVYLAANWAAPFGIALMLDRLAALMLLLTAIIALVALIFSMKRWARIGVHFHSLFQFLLAGLNGAFLTNDLFNLFVFFEVMLAASYGLALHGYNVRRIRAGMQYVIINLIASFLFLIGVALIYASTGTLNLADLGARIPDLEADKLIFLQIGATVLALVFLTKSAMWPLGFWLPGIYSAASPPVAAMLVLMTKVGVYAVLRVWTTAFSPEAGAAAGFGLDALLIGGLMTIVFGTVGMLASEDGPRMAAFGAIISSGTLLTVIGFGDAALLEVGLYYLLGSTLATAAFMLLSELVDRIKTPGSTLLAVTMEAFAIEDKPEEPVGVGIPGSLAFLGLSFAGCALVITSMPPLSGFIAKFGMFHAMLDLTPASGIVSALVWTTMALLLLSGLAGIVALMRFGVRSFWVPDDIVAPRLNVSEAMPVLTLLTLCVALTILAAPTLDYLNRTVLSLSDPAGQSTRVLGEQPIIRPAMEANR